MFKKRKGFLSLDSQAAKLADMTIQTRTWKLLCLSALVLPAFASGCATGGLASGQIAPDFSLADLDDQKVAMAQQKGSVVLLNFWATW